MDDKQTEQWRPVVGYEGLYEVSDMGRVRSLDRLVEKRSPAGNLFMKRAHGTVLRSRANTFGHRQVALHRGGVRKERLVHLLVLEAFAGPCPGPLFETRHLNGDPGDNRLQNITYGTRKENGYDRIYHGTRHLSPEQVREIRRLRALGGLTLREIGKRVGASRNTVYSVGAGRSYLHVR